MNVEHVKKGWGKEVIFANNKDYCGKLLVFDKEGACGSMHYHMIKDETWYVQSGKFKVSFIDTRTATVNVTFLNVGDIWHNPPGFPHCLEAMEDNSVIFEVSTADYATDSYRVFPGDSQQ
jgi:mannose-6-phosphate isomerase-like protein (cupin superfamily)